MARGIIFVDVFDGEDGIVRVQGTGFFDAEKGKTRQKIFPGTPSCATYQAYAPWPIVLETIRKGTSLGSGANCECCMVAVIN